MNNAMKWISVSDKMPDPYIRVLVYDSHHKKKTIGFQGIGVGGLWGLVAPFERYDYPTSLYITHWMPLPDNPIDKKE